MKFQVGGPASAPRRANTGFSGSETTLDFANIGNETPKFDLQKWAISSSERGSWPATSSAGKPRTTKPASRCSR